VSGATFDKVVDITRQIEMVHSQEQVEREAKGPRGQGGFSDVPSGGSSTTVGVIISDILRGIAQFTMVHRLATGHTVISRAIRHLVHYRRSVLTRPRQLRFPRVVPLGTRSSSSVRGGVVSSAEILVTLREIALGC